MIVFLELVHIAQLACTKWDILKKIDYYKFLHQCLFVSPCDFKYILSNKMRWKLNTNLIFIFLHFWMRRKRELLPKKNEVISGWNPIWLLNSKTSKNDNLLFKRVYQSVHWKTNISIDILREKF